ncbi:hypothetical protein M127_1573 [Bacteroides fragilis str. S6L5]|nr:hypothetical protein M127_1573 [Bacteroides fragilis str. S6L5]
MICISIFILYEYGGVSGWWQAIIKIDNTDNNNNFFIMLLFIR